MRKIEIKTLREWRTHTSAITDKDQLIATITVAADEGKYFSNAKSYIRAGLTRLVGNDVVLKAPRPQLDSINRETHTIPAGTKLFSLVVEPAFKSFVNERVVFDGLNARLFGEFAV